MANILDRFNLNVAGSSGEIVDYDPVITASGDFKRTSGMATILKSWLNILQTPLGTYDHDPAYGSELYKFIFQPADSRTQDRIKREIKTRLTAYDDRARITGIEVEFLSNRKGFNVIIEVLYQGDKSTLQTAINEANVRSFLE